MERLTYKNYIEEYEVNFEKSSDKNWSIAESDTHIKVTGEPIEKLGELEDILESWHIENLEELKTRLHDCQVYHLQNNSNETLIHNLKNELADLQHKLEVAEKALNEMANYAINDDDSYDLVSDFNIENERYDEDHFGINTCDVVDYFKTQAEKEIKGE